MVMRSDPALCAFIVKEDPQGQPIIAVELSVDPDQLIVLDLASGTTFDDASEFARQLTKMVRSVSLIEPDIIDLGPIPLK
jgi:hypothetical protein